VEEGREEEGRGWLEKAAAAGEPEGLFNLGLLRIKEGDYQGAVGLFFQAWERGLTVAAKNIGVAYYKGVGVEAKDWDLARLWLARAGDKDSLALAAVVKSEQEKLGRDEDPSSIEL
jgi:TPR repeat protein